MSSTGTFVCIRVSLGESYTSSSGKANIGGKADIRCEVLDAITHVSMGPRALAPHHWRYVVRRTFLCCDVARPRDFTYCSSEPQR
jgi:hypothetical protein